VRLWTVALVDDFEGLPATDALRLAQNVGVDLDDLGALAATDDRFEHVWLPDPAFHLRHLSGPLEAHLTQDDWLAVPVYPARRSREVSSVPLKLAAELPTRAGRLAELLAGMQGDVFDHPAVVEDLKVVAWPAAPLHHENHTGPRCELCLSLSCWRACADVVLAAAAELADLSWYHGSGNVLIPPLLPTPPGPAVRRRRMTDIFDEQFTLALGSLAADVVLVPSVVRPPSTRA
jgi:hypothetical protein